MSRMVRDGLVTRTLRWRRMSLAREGLGAVGADAGAAAVVGGRDLGYRRARCVTPHRAAAESWLRTAWSPQARTAAMASGDRGVLLVADGVDAGVDL